MKWNLLLLIWMGQYHAAVCQLYYYFYSNENKTWTEAQQHCREKHTDLVTVTNMKAVKGLINSTARNMKEAWIGLYDQTNGTRTWRWSLSGVQFDESDTNWNPGEPNDDGGLQNCGILWNKLKWGDVSCNARHYFLCYNDRNSSKKFHLIQENKTWQEAQSYCRENHTDLISGTKQLQDEEVEKLMNSTSGHSHIGLFRDTWRWSDGSSSSFRHWNKGFDNQRINSGQCGVVVFDDGGRWRNENCDVQKPFICYDDNVILIKENKTWKDALTYCRDNYNDLVTINSVYEEELVQEETKNASTPFVWLGLRYTCFNNIWFWVCEEMISYKNPISPGWMNDCNMSGAMQAGGEYRWFQRNDTEELNFICSKV